ncbi:hypothetical protein DAPPUDRAFT_241464 [Daphnia pulex]|uniref:MARVEL domain-containing protein n=1 Tax=Daphnia pulex TaxID=6669 RepID=E9GEB2_DAPPU|nr:hypothetical protein DAPPUDRAFT_241464 [Daphnia pulex]|eukprot:EFX82338.1 hypothetical protein DAPPUDRAFT_241464 [Daphnia pulex]
MEKILAIINIFVGLLTFSLQTIGISALVVFKDVDWDPDKAGAGIWGGIDLIIFALLLILKMLKKSEIVLGMAVVAALIGVMLIGLYSWSIDMYQPLIADCNYLPLSFFKICDRAAIDSLMIICGILAVIVNGIIAMKAPSTASK